jgi:hypothetical protein
MFIDAFKAVIAKNNPLDPSRYNVAIISPLGPLDLDYTMMCNRVTVPGRSFGTADKYTHGPNRKVPYAELYVDINTSFYVDEMMNIRKYFEDWQEFIGGDDYYMKYYNEIIGSVIINVENHLGIHTAKYELFEAYPVGISTTELAYSEQNVVPEFTVSWAYHHFERTETVLGNIASAVSEAAAPATAILNKAGNVLRGI